MSATATIAVLASGGGTTVETFIHAYQAGKIDTEVGLVICSRKDAGVFQRIAGLNATYGTAIPCILINSKTHPVAADEIEMRGRQTHAEESAIIERILEGGYDLVVNMGYMKRNGPRLVYTFGWRDEYTSIYQARMLNTDPGLLPETKGLYGELVQQHVINHHLPYSGQTLHIVAEDYDDGPTIAEHKVKVRSGDTPQSLFARVQAMEKRKLPKDVQSFLTAQKVYNKQQR